MFNRRTWLGALIGLCVAPFIPKKDTVGKIEERETPYLIMEFIGSNCNGNCLCVPIKETPSINEMVKVIDEKGKRGWILTTLIYPNSKGKRIYKIPD